MISVCGTLLAILITVLATAEHIPLSLATGAGNVDAPVHPEYEPRMRQASYNIISS